LRPIPLADEFGRPATKPADESASCGHCNKSLFAAGLLNRSSGLLCNAANGKIGRNRSRRSCARASAVSIRSIWITNLAAVGTPMRSSGVFIHVGFADNDRAGSAEFCHEGAVVRRTIVEELSERAIRGSHIEGLHLVFDYHWNALQRTEFLEECEVEIEL